jgi:hypothetical protein
VFEAERAARLAFLCRPVQSQGRHEEEKHQHEPRVHEKEERDSAKFLFIHFKEMKHPCGPRAPERKGYRKKEQDKYHADNEGAEEDVAKENDFLVFHGCLFWQAAYNIARRKTGGDVGALERWSVGALERWSVGALKRWSVGALERWSVGALKR